MNLPNVYGRLVIGVTKLRRPREGTSYARVCKITNFLEDAQDQSVMWARLGSQAASFGAKLYKIGDFRSEAAVLLNSSASNLDDFGVQIKKP